MTNLTRKTAKIFGETASTTGSDPEIGQFGSAKAGTYLGTNDVATIQSLPAWSNGWIDAVTPTHQFPTLPERTAVDYVQSYQNAYLLQKGVAEWDSGTTYYTGDFAKGVGEGKLYVSKVDNNLNHAVTDGTYWEEFSSGAFRNIGEIVQSTIPLTDAGLHLLDGALLNYGSYQAFIDYIADLYDSGDYTAIFDTEANWQATVTLSGVCDKFVYDSVNNTVRLPKYGNQILTKTPTIASTVPVKGNGMTLGLLDGTNKFGLNMSGQSYLSAYSGSYGTSQGLNNNTGTNPVSGHSIGLTTDPTKSGLVADLSSITNYPLNCYYYIVIATTTKTQIQVDIDEIATDLNGKADVDLTNINASCAPIDGQWVGSNLTLINTDTSITSGTTSTFSLSSYLPNDGYKYEVMLSVIGCSAATNGNTFKLCVGSSIIDVNNNIVAAAIARSNATYWCANNTIIPIGTDRNVYLKNVATHNGTVFAFYASGYRRIGTNA